MPRQQDDYRDFTNNELYGDQYPPNGSMPPPQNKPDPGDPIGQSPRGYEYSDGSTRPNNPAAPKAAAPAAQYAGWDSVKNGDWSRAWSDWSQMKYGQSVRGGGFANMPTGGLAQAVADFNKETGANATANGDTINFGNGQSADAVTNSHGQGPQYLWNSALGGNNGQPGGGGGGYGGGGGGYGGGGGWGGFGGDGGPTGGFGQQYTDLYNQLMARSKQSLEIDPTTDSVIRPQVDNYAAMQERSRRNYLNDLSESNSPYAEGANELAKRQTSETAGYNTANLQSQLTANELTSRRTEIQNALTEMGSLLTAEQQLSLQRELGLIDASLKQQGINSQNDQFMADYGLRSIDNQNYWDWKRNGGG